MTAIVDHVHAPLLMSCGLGARRLTAADLACLPSDLPSGAVDFELDQGMLMERGPARVCESIIQKRIWRAFVEHGDERGHGETMLRVGIVLARDPDSVLGPRVSFWANARLPLKESAEGYVESIPALVVEISSKWTLLPDSRIATYLRAGVRIVWIVDNDARSVTVHFKEGEPLVLREKDVLRVEDLIPGMELPVTKLFAARP